MDDVRTARNQGSSAYFYYDYVFFTSARAPWATSVARTARRAAGIAGSIHR